MTHTRTNWLQILGARGLDIAALAAGDPAAEAALRRHVRELAEAAAALAAPPEPAFAGTQAAGLAAMARAPRKEAA